MAGAHHVAAGGRERELLTVDAEVATERAFLPFLQVANHAEPRAAAGELEHQLVVGGVGRLEQEHLDECAGFLAEVHACLDDLGVVEDHERTLGQIFGQAVEHVVADLAFVVDQQLAVVALADGEFGYPFVGQLIAIV